MAEVDERTLDEGADPNALSEVEGDQAPAEGHVEEASPSVEEIASEFGWVAKENFRGDPDQWRPAAEFIKAGRNSQQSMARELRIVREELSRMGQVSSRILEDKIAERDQYWQGEHKRAVQEGDEAGADRAVRERIKLQTEAPQPLAPQPQYEVQSFVERNKWYSSDPLARARAFEICDRLAKQGEPADVQLREAERMIRKEFPEHFAPPPKQPAAVQTAAQRNTASSSRERGFNDMPAASQQMARDYEKRHGIKPDEFARSYWADQANQRKVG